MSNPKLYYTESTWDVESWMDVIAVEYESLIKAYDFNQALLAMPRPGHLKLLDLGCGTAIFPSFVDRVLSESIKIDTDLLDISAASLATANTVLERLEHFHVGRQIHSSIEVTKDEQSTAQSSYDLIWAIHSLTTVDIQQMAEALEKILTWLKPTGRMMIYQLTSGSAYQRLHGFYRSNHPNGWGAARYMQFEDTVQILQSMQAPFEVMPLQFEHRVDADRRDLLQMYLRKVVLDDSIESRFFEPILSEILDPSENVYRFQQTINFGIVSPINAIAR